MSLSEPPFNSSYPPLTKPDFKPTVPDFLLEGASEQDKYIIAQLSLVNQYAQWSITTELSTHEQVLKTNGRVLRAESDVRALKSAVENLQRDMDHVKPVTKVIAGAWRFLKKKPVMILGSLALFYVAFYLYPYLLKEDPILLLKDIVKAWLGA